MKVIETKEFAMSQNMPQKWKSPFSLLEDMEDMTWFPAIPTAWTSTGQGLSIYEDDNSVTVEAALPGLNENDIEITFEKGSLMIRGEKKETEEDKKRRYFRRSNKSFMYHMTVPGNIDEKSDPKAEFKDGLLKVSFSKQKQAQPKHIPIQKK
jgi:HSP20 family protein